MLVGSHVSNQQKSGKDSFSLALTPVVVSFCLRVVNSQYDAKTYREIGVENRNLGPGVGAVDPHATQGSQHRTPPNTIHDSLKRPNELLKPQPVSPGWRSPCMPPSLAQTCPGASHRPFRPPGSGEEGGGRRQANKADQTALTGCLMEGRHVLRVARCNSQIPIPIPIPVLGRLIQAFCLWHRST